MMMELKPCPFCGSDAEAFHYYGTAYMDESWHIECIAASCGCGTCHHVTEAEAIATWNTRASLTVGDGDAEARGYARGIREAADNLTSLATERDAMKLPKAATSIIRQCARRIENILAKLGATND